jgi:predicted  nucleic acid-binding Zn-ribbon protein
MKTKTLQTSLVIALFCARAVFAGDYASDLKTVGEAQAEAIQQARQMLERMENPTSRQALQKAVQTMEHAQILLSEAAKSPEKLAAAVTEQQLAYEGLLKLIPHDFQVSSSRNRAGRGGRAGQPGRGQIDQLDMAKEDNRYETERQATAAQTPQQREQLQISDRLKQLAQRQQDLNDRLKELQTALAEAKTDQEREDIQRQLKRLSDEERQMLADVDDLRQSMEQSPNASSLANARQQLEKTRSDTQRASQELQNQSVSQALAAGARAQQEMQELRESMRSQASSQFSRQMRQMRSEARDLASQEEKIGNALDTLTNPERKSLDDSAQRQQLIRQMDQQKDALTNLLGQMQSVSEHAETSEPLLSEQLYETVRRAGQMRNENLLQTGQQLVDHGLVSQAGQAEHAVQKNFNELRDKVERAAQSVLGNEAEALRYAQKELDELAAQVEREAGGAGTNNAKAAGTNLAAGLQPGNDGRRASSQNQGRPGSEPGSATAQAGGATNSATGTQPGNGGQQASDQNSGQAGSAPGSATAQAGSGQTPGAGNQPGNGGEQASSQNSGQGGAERGANGGAGGGGDRLLEAARQFGPGGATAAGGGRGGLGINGPITGNQYLDWTDRMRQVEEVVDSTDLRDRLAEVRERVGVFRSDFRQRHQKPDAKAVQNLVVAPLAEVRARLDEDLARMSNAKSLVPLDHEPVPENFSEMVRKYYEKLGGGQ